MDRIRKMALAMVVVAGMGFAAADRASAGTLVGGQVFIDALNHAFSGALGSADATQFIGCSTTGTSVFCQARNSAGTRVSCSSSDPAHLEALKAMGDDSRLYVRYDASGACTQVNVYSYSYWESR